jgi:hypothetical protein
MQEEEREQKEVHNEVGNIPQRRSSQIITSTCL